MPPREKVLFSWSGGKDSALALHEILREGRHDVVALLTTVAGEFRRVSHHGVREELLELQAEAIGLPLHRVVLPSGSALPCTNAMYEELMAGALAPFRDRGVRWVAHGDIFLRDLREYRERNLAKLGLKGIYPLWDRDTGELVRTFVRLGFRAYLACVEERLGSSFAGRLLDDDFIRDIPPGVDPCGERGEYHSFVVDGPIFSRPLPVRVGETVMREGRYYADLLPAGPPIRRPPAPGDFPPVR